METWIAFDIYANSSITISSSKEKKMGYRSETSELQQVFDIPCRGIESIERG